MEVNFSLFPEVGRIRRKSLLIRENPKETRSLDFNSR